MGKNVSANEMQENETHQAILHNGAEAQKVHDDLKLFITLGEAKTKSACLGMGFHMEWLRLPAARGDAL